MNRHAQRRRRYTSLFRRVAAVNALVMIAAVVATTAVLARDRLSSIAVDEEIAVFIVALAVIAAVNLYLLRRVIRPLQALTALARRVDLMGPGERLPDAQPSSEAGELALTFNEMLDRLETRRSAILRVLAPNIREPTATSSMAPLDYEPLRAHWAARRGGFRG